MKQQGTPDRDAVADEHQEVGLPMRTSHAPSRRINTEHCINTIHTRKPQGEALRRSVQARATAALLDNVARLNRMAKVASPRDRHRLYIRKAELLSQLVVVGDGRVDDFDLATGLIAIRLASGRRLHCPVSRLTPAAKTIINITVNETLAALSADSTSNTVSTL